MIHEIRNQKKKTTPQAQKRRLLQVVLFALLLVITLIMVSPFVWMVSTALKHPQDVFSAVPQFLPTDQATGKIYATLDNFTQVLETSGLKKAFVNSLVVVLVVVPLKVFLAALAGYAFARIPFWGRDQLFMVLLSTMMIPWVALLVPRLLVTKSLGMYDSLWGLIVPMCISVFDVFLMRQYFMSQPKELEEAAMMDGASRFTTFLRVNLPLARPVISVVAISALIWHWNDLTWPLVILSSPENYTVPLALALLANSRVPQPNLIMAASAIATIPVMVMFLIFQRRIIDGIVLSTGKDS